MTLARIDPLQYAGHPLLLGAGAFSLLASGGLALRLYQASNPREAVLAGAGLLVSVLLACGTWGLVCLRARIRQQVRSMTQDLRRMAMVVEHTSNAVVGMDLGLRVLWVNAGFTRTTGWPATECLGRPLAELIAHPEGDPSARSALRHASLRGEDCRVELLCRRKDGSDIWMNVEIQPTLDASGRLTGWIEIALDISHLKRVEGLLQQARDAALQASQAKSQFLSNMSHELRTPMNAVLGMLALLQGTPLDARQADYARKAHGAARGLLDLLDDMLDLSKVEAGKMSLHPRPFSFETLLRELSTLLSVQVGDKPLEVVFDLDPDLPLRLLGDDLRLRQILINLCGNAIKFTERGEVRIEVRLLQLHEGQARVRLSVRDTGIGISEAELGRLFQDFTQAHAGTSHRFGGTGLGLSICQRLAGLMGTRIEVESQAGHGSCFFMDLALPGIEPPPALPAAGRRALVIEANASARAALVSQLRQLGHEAEGLASSEQALARWSAVAAERPVVLLAWNMPGLEGWEGVHTLRRLPGGQSATLLAMGTVAHREAVEGAAADHRLMVNGFLAKPATPSLVREALDTPSAAPAAVSPVQRPRRLTGLSLLVAEDNALNQQIARELLEREGAQVTIVSDGREAVSTLRARPAGFDLVLMDLLMPVLDGIAATGEIRSVLGLRSLPIVAMTANAMEGDRQACLAAGMDEHVGKPFQIHHLVQVVLAHARPKTAPVADTPSPHGPLPPWDRARALSHLGGDARLLEDVLGVFLTSLEDALQQLPGLLQPLPGPQALRLVHTLKGQAATLGAQPLSDAARQTEALLASPPVPPQRLAQGLAAIQAAADELRAAVPQLVCRGHPASTRIPADSPRTVT